jgi:hypothetical protein
LIKINPIFILVFLVLLLGCISQQPGRLYVCSTGHTVSDPSLCPSEEVETGKTIYVCPRGETVSDPNLCPRETTTTVHGLAISTSTQSEVKVTITTTTSSTTTVTEPPKVESDEEEEHQIKPTLMITSMPAIVVIDRNITIAWSVSGEGLTTSHTAVHYGFESHQGKFGTDVEPAEAGYTWFTPEFDSGNFELPAEFSSTFNVANTGFLYLRAHVTVDDLNYWTSERAIEVVWTDIKLSTGNTSIRSY